jgi:hypothetical protein
MATLSAKWAELFTEVVTESWARDSDPIPRITP